MKKINKLILTLSISMLALNQAHGSTYIGGDFFGMATQDIDHKKKDGTNRKYTANNSIGGSLGIGYEFNNNLALELGVNYQPDRKFIYNSSAGLEHKQSVSLVAPMIKAYYNYYFSDNMKLYVGAGVGMSFVNSERETSYKGNSKDKTAINNNINKKKKIDTNHIAGAGYVGFGKKINNIAFDIGYSYGYYGKSSDDANQKYVSPLEIYSHSVVAGIKFYF